MVSTCDMEDDSITVRIINASAAPRMRWSASETLRNLAANAIHRGLGLGSLRQLWNRIGDTRRFGRARSRRPDLEAGGAGVEEDITLVREKVGGFAGDTSLDAHLSIGLGAKMRLAQEEIRRKESPWARMA